MTRALIGMVVAATLAVGSAPGLATELELVTVQDSAGRFLIAVPSTWRVDRSLKDRALSAKSPEPGPAPDTLEVFVRDTPVAMSPAACGSQIAWVMRMTIGSWTTVSEGPDTIGGLAAFTREYTWRLKTGEERHSIQTCVTVGRRAFVIIGTTENSPLRRARILPELSRMIATFRPGGAPPAGDPNSGEPAKER